MCLLVLLNQFQVVWCTSVIILRLNSAETVACRRLKFCMVDGRWGARDVLKLQSDRAGGAPSARAHVNSCSPIDLTWKAGNCKTDRNRPTPLRSRANSSATGRRSDKRQTRMDRGEMGLGYCRRFTLLHAPRAAPETLPQKIDRFPTIFRIFVCCSITKHDMKLKLVSMCREMNRLYHFGVTETPKCIFFLILRLTFDILIN